MATRSATFSVVFAVVLLQVLTTAVSAIPYAQSLALTEFYISTGGSGWSNKAGWLDGDYSDPCSFHGIMCSKIKNNTVVTTLALESNNLVGAIPAYFFTNMTELEVVQLYGNPQLGGQIPDFPAGAPLAALLLYSCSFTGSIPSSIFTPSVTVIHLMANKLTGGLPTTVAKCGSISALILGQNQLNIGVVDPSICSAQALHQIDFTDCGVSSLPACFTSSLGGLTNLNFQDNMGLSLSVEDVLCPLTNLQDLYLMQTSIGGTIPTCVSNWGGMKNLIVENTQMSGTIPAEIFSLRNLVSLHLALSGFSGAIPDSFGNLENLADVFLAGKKGSRGFEDPLPPSLFQRGTVQSLTLQFNSFKGPLPRLTGMSSLAAFDFSNNLELSTPFPAEIFTDLWAVPPQSKDVLRSLHFDFTPVYGTIPSTSVKFQQLNQQNGFSFTHSQLTGYIPNSTFTWVQSASSLLNLVQDCPRLLPPLMPWVAPLVGSTTFTGMFIDIEGVTSQAQTFTMAGGEAFTASVSESLENFPAGLLFCGFCVTEDQENCTSTSLTSLNPEQLRAILLLAPATVVVGQQSTIACTTPTGITNANPTLGLYYQGPGYGASYDKELFCLSQNLAAIRFYNPNPHLQRLVPPMGRPEGCTLVTAIGAGFANAPNASLLLDNNIETAPGTVLNDTAAVFYIPRANGSYSYPLGNPLVVNFLPTSSPLHVGTTAATYAFADSCRTPLVPCVDGFTDPEQCPTPLCRCNSVGTCNYNATSPSVWSCGCRQGFDGLACEACAENYFGGNCDKCPCNLGHGTCDWGLIKSGTCSCNKYFTGADCTISIIGLGVSIPLGLVAIGVAVFVFRRKRAANLDQELLVNNKY